MIQLEPKKGMDCTYEIGTDSYAYTVRQIINKRTIVVTDDRFVNPKEKVFTFRKNGSWRKKGYSMKYPGIIKLGFKHTYLDPNF